MEPLRAFTYQPLASNADFRLFLISPGSKNDRITGTLRGANLVEATNNYCALSYRWGDPIFTKEIIINDCSFKITNNLHDALRNLRQAKRSTLVWIDQICINQNDDDEKGRQLKLMSKIYECASGVPIWLGNLEHPKRTQKILNRLKPVFKMLPDECFDGQCDIKSVQRLTPKQMSIIHLPSPKNTGWEALRRLLSADWFSRSWIIQEASMAKIAYFSWGKGWIAWDGMVAVLQALHLVLPENVLGCSLDDIPANTVLDIDRVRRSLKNDRAADVISLALRYKHLGAGEPKDKIYAFISLSREPEQFPVTKEITIENLYCLVAHKAIGDAERANVEGLNLGRANTGESEEEHEWHPDPIAIQGPSSRLMALICSAGLANHTPECRLPSWVPDWAFQSKVNPIWTAQVERRTSGVTWWPPNIYESRIVRTRLALKSAYERWQSRRVHSVPTIQGSSSFTMTAEGTRVTKEATTLTTSISGGPARIGRTDKYIFYDAPLTTVSWEGSYHIEGPVIGATSLPDTLVLVGACINRVGLTTKTNLEHGELLDENPSALQNWLSLAYQMSLGSHSRQVRRGSIFADRPLIHVLCMDMVTEEPEAAVITEVPPLFKVTKDSGYDEKVRCYLETHHYLLALRNIRYREFFLTIDGLMGLGPRGIEYQDEIWVIAGFKVPLIFRKEGGVHRLIGECFIDSADMMAQLTRDRCSYDRIHIR